MVFNTCSTCFAVARNEFRFMTSISIANRYVTFQSNNSAESQYNCICRLHEFISLKWKKKRPRWLINGHKSVIFGRLVGIRSHATRKLSFLYFIYSIYSLLNCNIENILKICAVFIRPFSSSRNVSGAYSRYLCFYCRDMSVHRRYTYEWLYGPKKSKPFINLIVPPHKIVLNTLWQKSSKSFNVLLLLWLFRSLVVWGIKFANFCPFSCLLNVILYMQRMAIKTINFMQFCCLFSFLVSFDSS